MSERLKLDQALIFINGMLSTGPVEAKRALHACQNAGFSLGTIRRAKRQLKAISRRQRPATGYSVHGCAHAPWMWCLDPDSGFDAPEYVAAKPILSGNLPVGEFVAGCLVIERGATVLANELRDAFTTWRTAQNLSDDDLSWARVAKVLTDFGCVSANLQWHGVTLRERKL